MQKYRSQQNEEKLEVFKSDTEGTQITQVSVANSVSEFTYDPDEEITFSSFYGRYENILQRDGLTKEKFACCCEK